MTEVNKPLESDTDDEILDDDFELEEDKEQQDETSVGATKDVDATQEFLTKVSEIAGFLYNFSSYSLYFVGS